jgi:lysophospholipid acyltransferase (LPLAT)-like uncharacterized protein
MIKKRFKVFLKNSSLVHNLVVNIIFLYLKIVYLTNKWEYVWPRGWDEDRINNLDGALFAIWHNRLTFCMHIFRKINNAFGLASPHTDGKLITDIIRKMNFGVIEGSTNRNATGSLKEIISKIKSGDKVVITPDGPRGPVYKINSSITRLANKYDKPLIPISCTASKYYELKSWDKMIIPKFFGTITVYIGSPLKLSGDETSDNALLEQSLIQLSDK